MKLQKMNKRGFSLSGWAEIALFVTLFVLLFVGLVAEMNVKTGQNLDGSFGLESKADGTKSSLSDYQQTIESGVSSGQSSSTGQGISLSSTWSIILAGTNIIWDFLKGNWIQLLVGMVGLPQIVATILQIIYVLSMGFIVLRLVLKLKP